MAAVATACTAEAPALRAWCSRLKRFQAGCTARCQVGNAFVTGLDFLVKTGSSPYTACASSSSFNSKIQCFPCKEYKLARAKNALPAFAPFTENAAALDKRSKGSEF